MGRSILHAHQYSDGVGIFVVKEGNMRLTGTLYVTSTSFFLYKAPYNNGIPISVTYTESHSHFPFDNRFDSHFPLLKITRPRVDTVSRNPWSQRCLFTCSKAITHPSGGIGHTACIFSTLFTLYAQSSFPLNGIVILAIPLSVVWPFNSFNFYGVIN